MPQLLEQKNWQVFCPRCGDRLLTEKTRAELWKLIDQPCRKCGKLGVDALERAA
jgi:ribosomal protein L37AE/L43A